MAAQLMMELVQQYGPWGAGCVVLWHFRDYISVSFNSPSRKEEKK